MKPVIAIVGRPNVGKSTLFNRLTRSRDALVADRPGITRDRKYGHGEYNGRSFLLVDTGGLGEEETESTPIADQITQQALQAVIEANAVIWMVDGRAGLTAVDETLADQLRPLNRNIFVAVNKTEGQSPDIVTAEFHVLGIGNVHAISAKRGSGIEALMNRLCDMLPETTGDSGGPDESLAISIIGRPNVGKSTLVNRILGEERVLTFDQPGTTRDSIRILFERESKSYSLIDTAGVRRRSRITDAVEKFSVIKTLLAIEECDLVILVVDARDEITEQDASLLGLAVDSGRGIIIAANKWDGLDPSKRRQIRGQCDRKLGFIDYACIHYISALHGSGVGKLFTSVEKIRRSINVSPSTPELNKILRRIIENHPPQLVKGRRIKLRYAHLGGKNPLRIVIHGNQVKQLPDSYRRYLANSFRKELGLIGTPVFIELRQGENPYRDKGQSGKIRKR